MLVNIAFWSEEPDCGTTAAMLAISAYLSSSRTMENQLAIQKRGSSRTMENQLAIQKRGSSRAMENQLVLQKSDNSKSVGHGIIIQRDKKEEDLSLCFSRKEIKVAESCAYYALSGMDELMSQRNGKPLSREQLQGALVPLMENQLSYLPTGKRLLPAYYPGAWESILEQVLIMGQELADFVWMDCGNRQDSWTMNYLHKADLAVVVLTQKKEILDTFFKEHWNISKRVLYLINQYDPGSVYNKNNMKRMYRLSEEQIGILPYNLEFQTACWKGKLDRFISQKHFFPMSLQNEIFFRELDGIVEKLFQLGGVHESKRECNK